MNRSVDISRDGTVEHCSWGFVHCDECSSDCCWKRKKLSVEEGFVHLLMRVVCVEEALVLLRVEGAEVADDR